MNRLINFTRGEARALLHRLETWDCIAEALAEEQDPSAVAERAEAMERELRNCGYLHANPASPLDLAILVECVEGSTWPAIHDPAGNTDNTPQAHAGAVRCLWRAMLKIARGFDIAPHSIQFPQA